MDTTQDTTTIATVVDAYLAAYGESDPDLRAVHARDGVGATTAG